MVDKSNEGLTCYRFRAATFACTDHNQELHDIVVDLVAPALHNKDILSSNWGVDVDRSLSIAEFLELAVSRSGA